MDSNNPLEQVDATLQTWNRDGAPFSAVQKVLEALKASNQKFSSISDEMKTRSAEVGALCDSTRTTRDANSQQFQQWFRPAEEESNYFGATLADIQKQEIPPDGDLPEDLYGKFDNSHDPEPLDKDELSKFIDQHRAQFDGAAKRQTV